MTRSLLYASALVVSTVWPANAQQTAPALTMAEAMTRAAQRQPFMESARLEVEARAAEVEQARRWLNPLAVVEVEDLGRSVGTSAPSQTTLSVSQRVELGGKRGLRSSLAAAERDIAAGDLMAARHRIESDVATAFVHVLAAEADMNLAEQDATTAEATATAIRARVDAGVAAPPDADRAQAAAASSRIQARAAQQRLETARIALAGTWSAPPEEAAVLAGTLSVPAIPPLATLIDALDASPIVRRGMADVQRVAASQNVASGGRVPDLDVDFGYRRLHDIAAHSWLVGASITVPLFDRQAERIAAASLRSQAAGRTLEATRLTARTAVAIAHREATESALAVAAIDADVLPLHERVYNAVSEGYAAGRFGLLQLLDARQSLSDARRARLSSLFDLYTALIAIHSMLGNTDQLAALTTPGGTR